MDPDVEETLVTSEGQLGRLVEGDIWPTWGDAVGLRDHWLVRPNTRLSQVIREPPPSRELLEGLVRLVGASEEEVRDHVRIAGPLGVCGHGLPGGHDWRPVPAGLLDTERWPLDRDMVTLGAEPVPPTRARLIAIEPVEAWRYWAGQADAILRLAAAHRDGKAGTPAHWRTLTARGPWASGGDDTVREGIKGGAFKASGAPDSALARDLLADAVDTWLVLARVRPKVYWRGSAPILTLGGGLQLGVLGLQLLAATADQDALVRCAGCPRWTIPTRSPVANQRTFCPTCRSKRKPQKLASRDWRRRQKESDPDWTKQQSAARADRRRASRAEVAAEAGPLPERQPRG